MRRQICAVGALVLAATMLTSCPEPPNYLDGSIGEVFDLAFDEVRIRKYLGYGDLQIEYLKNATDAGGGKDVVVQVTIKTPEAGFPLNTEIKFDQVEGKIHRVAPGDDFPAITEGRIDFSAGGNKVGEQTTGKFSAIFENKRTLRGNFDGKMEEATAN